MYYLDTCLPVFITQSNIVKIIDKKSLIVLRLTMDLFFNIAKETETASTSTLASASNPLEAIGEGAARSSNEQLPGPDLFSFFPKIPWISGTTVVAVLSFVERAMSVIKFLVSIPLANQVRQFTQLHPLESSFIFSNLLFVGISAFLFFVLGLITIITACIGLVTFPVSLAAWGAVAAYSDVSAPWAELYER